MYIGFHLSPGTCQAPVSARFRALCTHAPSSCQTTPTVENHGGSATGKSARSVAASSRMAANASANCRADSSLEAPGCGPSRLLTAGPFAAR